MPFTQLAECSTAASTPHNKRKEMNQEATTPVQPSDFIMIDDIKRDLFKIDGANIPTPPIAAGIYGLMCLKTGSMYVGSSNGLKRRLRDHFRKLRNGTHENHKVQNMYRAHPDHWAWVFLEPIADMSAVDILRRENQYLKFSMCDLNIEKRAWSSYGKSLHH
jgi:predicted GIY-YIG superfamily endonuclease